MRYLFHFCLFSFISLHSFNSSASWKTIKEEIESELDVVIITDTSFHGTWPEVKYDSIVDTVALEQYLILMQREYAKYPDRFFYNIGISKIIIGQNLLYAGQNRAAIPDPYAGAVYFEIKPSYDDNYLVHVLHHELHHCTEYAIWQNMYYRWKKWSRVNRCWFKYGNGGASAYEGENRYIDWYSFIHPKKGFLNLYSTTGEEEDRCEVFALIMTDSERHYLLDYCKKDRLLRKKVKLMLGILSFISEEENAYWDQKMNVI